MIDQILASCHELSKIPPEAAEAFVQSKNRLLDNVNSQLVANPKIRELTGRNPLDLMRNNHKNHAMLMSAVLRLNSFDLLARTLPWVYRTYHARGFSYEYIPAELVAWQIAIYECLDNSIPKAEILAVYKWMIQHHEDMVGLSITPDELSYSVKQESSEMRHTLLALLLNGDSRSSFKLANQSVMTSDELKPVSYTHLTLPTILRV